MCPSHATCFWIVCPVTQKTKKQEKLNWKDNATLSTLELPLFTTSLMCCGILCMANIQKNHPSVTMPQYNMYIECVYFYQNSMKEEKLSTLLNLKFINVDTQYYKNSINVGDHLWHIDSILVMTNNEVSLCVGNKEWSFTLNVLLVYVCLLQKLNLFYFTMQYFEIDLCKNVSMSSLM